MTSIRTPANRTNHKRGFLTALVVGIIIFAGLTWVVRRMLDDWRAPTRGKWEKVHIGDTEATVRSLLGSPFREYGKDNAPKDYYIPGYGRKERPITGKVLIYMGNDLVLYLWLDERDRVEDLVTARS